MPTYEYECRKCGHQFERFQAITADPLKTCPKCRGKVARLLSTGSGLIFRGSGFYQTDYKKTSAPAMEKGESKKADSAKSDSGNQETAKPAKPAK
jgi:putative FmdB family regulatory protein